MFWSSHVNNEYYTTAERGSDAYFREIEQRRYAWHYHVRELFDSLAGSSGRLLEIGSGIGVDAIRLARCGFDVTAIDLTPEAIDTARSFAAVRGAAIDFRIGNAESLDFADATFDVVYSFGVLHHTPDIDRAVMEMHRVLKPRGTAYVMLYNRFSIVNLVHRALRLPYESPRNRRDDCPVVDTFSRRTARELFRSFSNVSIRTAYPFTYGFGRVANKLPLPVRRTLGRLVGWHLMIEAVR
jgi:SAM-dependent methyltransferase